MKDIHHRTAFTHALYASRCDSGAPIGYSERRVAQMFHGYVATDCGEAGVSLPGVMLLDKSLRDTNGQAINSRLHYLSSPPSNTTHMRLIVARRHTTSSSPSHANAPPPPRILELIHLRIRRRTLTPHILFHKPQTMSPAIKTMLSPSQLNKLIKVQIVDRRASVVGWIGSAFAARVVLLAGGGVVEGDVAGRADDAGIAGFAGGEEGFCN